MLIAKSSYFAKNVQNKKCEKNKLFWKAPDPANSNSRKTKNFQIPFKGVGGKTMQNFFAKAVQSTSFC